MARPYLAIPKSPLAPVAGGGRAIPVARFFPIGRSDVEDARAAVAAAGCAGLAPVGAAW